MRRALLSISYLVLALLLGGCMARPPVPIQPPALQLPQQWHVERALDGQRQDWLLVLQDEQGRLRWSLLDLLGIPQARQVLDGQRWQADGLLPPNPEARELFAAVLFALTPLEQLQAAYPEARGDARTRQLGDRWRVHVAPDTGALTLALSGGLHYRLSPLPLESAP